MLTASVVRCSESANWAKYIEHHVAQRPDGIPARQSSAWAEVSLANPQDVVLYRGRYPGKHPMADDVVEGAEVKRDGDDRLFRGDLCFRQVRSPGTRFLVPAAAMGIRFIPRAQPSSRIRARSGSGGLRARTGAPPSPAVAGGTLYRHCQDRERDCKRKVGLPHSPLVPSTNWPRSLQIILAVHVEISIRRHRGQRNAGPPRMTPRSLTRNPVAQLKNLSMRWRP